MRAIPVTEARDQWADIMDEVQREGVCLTRHGRPVAVILGVDGRDLVLVAQAIDRATAEIKAKTRRPGRTGRREGEKAE